MATTWKAGVLSLLLTAALVGCAVQPPVQEMAEARSAIDAAKQINSAQPQAKRELKSAEKALQEAATAIDREQYELARRKALEAKRKAQHAAQFHDQ